ncbi:MAG: hypothetical protein IKN43_13265, partial [Selenomonadaceae bacterium]|nr:hypothetical protein [Selenomonadaceae bacterium]
MKKIIVSLVLILSVTGFTIGLGIVYADVIPGVTEPFNPSAYYSATAISYEDSPSTFTLRDMARQGGEVYDPTRHAKNIEYVAKLAEWYNNVVTLLNLQTINSTPMSKDLATTTKQGVDKISQSAKNAWKIDEIDAFMNSEHFREFDKYDNDGTANYDPIEQTKEIEKVYKVFAEALEELRKTEEEENILVMRILEASKTAKGEMEMEQLEAQLEAIQAALIEKRNTLLALRVEFGNVQNKIKNDEALRKYQDYENKQLMIFDPYDRTEQQ